ncbi:MAG: SGNH/GDSL hydrolase family protein [Candidatus Eisenbacteria bacterium]|uniref:SGNH/GDSL hydrolase family protein n=1 Tax=Eiseniibacteriota bacterium TaxID=2212470 RepID=A0A948WDN9_UNCEI|nr:SGNH/GDSL hydrolase family protein [Candidatus Eisenbacteria bacterium]MBU1948969.1 SGNH/GDSL hydrolase family protein [Candidatus Eisenbacteria bacterium]MBU2692033.1 SGNH/GDSL hydrolase family protein [Candidatus Eisenbacteria bacterium]
MNSVRKILALNAPLTWLFYGDSITHGAYHTFGLRDYPELFDERVRGEMGRVSDTVINTAISGDTTRELLNGFARRVARFQPDLIFLMIGMNDCSEESGIDLAEFTGNLRRLADLAAGLPARLCLQTTCPILKGTAPDREPRFNDFMEAVREVARERLLPLIDHTAYWQMHPEQHGRWMSDSFHPNGHGHRVFAGLIFRELGIQSDSEPSGRFFIP